MLRWELTELARNIIEGQFQDLNDQIQQDIGSILAEAAKRGMADSGPTLKHIRDRCSEEFEKRAPLAWQELRRVFETAGEPLSEAEATDLKNEVFYRLIPVEQFLTKLLQKKAADMGLAETATGQDLAPQFPFTEAAQRAHAKIGHEIDLYLLSLKNWKKGHTDSMNVQSLPQVSTRGGRSEMATNPRKVFVVHGRNLQVRDAMFTFLRALGLLPIEWSQAVHATGKATPYIGEILDKAFSDAQAVVVLLTPDDVAYLREPLRLPEDPSHETQPTPQARPIVPFEAGMAIGRHPERTILVELGKVRPFSDIAGLHVLKLDNSSTKRQELAMRLETAGCQVDRTGIDWHLPELSRSISHNSMKPTS